MDATPKYKLTPFSEVLEQLEKDLDKLGLTLDEQPEEPETPPAPPPKKPEATPPPKKPEHTPSPKKPEPAPPPEEPSHKKPEETPKGRNSWFTKPPKKKDVSWFTKPPKKKDLSWFRKLHESMLYSVAESELKHAYFRKLDPVFGPCLYDDAGKRIEFGFKFEFGTKESGVI